MELVYQEVLKSSGYWNEKGYGAIFVAKEEDIKPVYEALVAQDDYWESDSGKSNLIHVLPELDGKSNPAKILRRFSEYIGKKDIYDLDKFVNDLKEKGIDIFIMWNYEDLNEY